MRDRERISARWTGFATSEKLAWWEHTWGDPVDIPAEKFAERSELDGFVKWGDVPSGFVIRGLYMKEPPRDQIKIVTRASTDDEYATFAHPRMPLLLMSSNPSEILKIQLPQQAQLELFDRDIDP